MIQVEGVIDEGLVMPLEGYLCELEISHWSIVQKTDNDVHRLFGYFNSSEEALENWADLRGVFPGIPENLEFKVLDDEDWKNAYKKYLKPWSYKNLHWVPVWERENYKVPEGEVAVFFDAGMAFGTGAHETTRLCGQRLIDYWEEHRGDLGDLRVIDAGCGSGILAISAKLLGFGKVMGFDIDEEAVRVSEENGELNGIGQEVVFKKAGLEEVFPQDKADFILANILANVLCEYSDVILGAVKSGGTLVLSGILVEEVEKVKTHFCKRVEVLWGSYSVDSRTLGEWVDLVLVREG